MALNHTVHRRSFWLKQFVAVWSPSRPGRLHTILILRIAWSPRFFRYKQSLGEPPSLLTLVVFIGLLGAFVAAPLDGFVKFLGIVQKFDICFDVRPPCI